MENTLKPGQQVRFSVVTAGYTPAVKDIIEYTLPLDWDSSQPKAISRVVATGGQTIRGRAGRVEVRTGKRQAYVALNEPYALLNDSDLSANFGPVTVPRGRLWLMGDNRGKSIDSRYHCSRTPAPPDLKARCDPTESTVPSSSVRAYRRAGSAN